MNVALQFVLGNCFFDGSVCTKDCGIGCVMLSSSGVTYELSMQLEFSCTNNQMEYEALVVGLEWLIDMKVKHVEAYGGSQLVVHQVCGESQCLDGTLNCYRELCMQLIREFDTFCISYIR
jgi:ribonuclease HI